MGTKIKICGIRDKETVKLCQDLKIDWIGFNFSEKSPRNISESQISDLITNRDASDFPKIVFLFFQNESSQITKLVDKYKPDYVQLIAGDPIDITHPWNQYRNNKTLLPAFRLQGRVGDESLLCPDLPFVILDSFKKDLGGGTGHAFPWEYVKDVKRPYLLAGGITPDNVEEAIRYLNPYGIDVASGVETDGIKNHKKIEELVRNVRGN
jgi:phosphoribosylanthranilate isomerase